MIGGNYAGTTAQIGLGALRRAAIPENQPDLGLTFAQALKAYKEKRQADEQQRKYEVYQEALKSGDPEAIKNAQIDLDPEAYQRAMAAKEADETDFNRKVQLMNMQNQKALDLDAARNRIARQNAQAEMDRQSQAIDAALASGQITPEQAQLAKTKLNLGNLVDFGGDDFVRAQNTARQEKELQNAVANGYITEQEAADARKNMAMQGLMSIMGNAGNMFAGKMSGMPMPQGNAYGLEGKALDTYNSETAKNIVKNCRLNVRLERKIQRLHRQQPRMDGKARASGYRINTSWQLLN